MITWLRVEGGVVFIAATALYWHFGGAWWLFLVLLLVPDLSALGYLAGPRRGATTYNLAHTTVGPVLLVTASWLFAWPPLVTQFGLIWLAHIGIDRALAYGLKQPTGFKQTHLSPTRGDIAIPDPS